MQRTITYLALVGLTLAALLCLSGCDMDHSDQAQLENGNFTSTSLNRAEWEGHSYIIYGGFQGGITHDPDCHCLTKKSKKESKIE